MAQSYTWNVRQLSKLTSGMFHMFASQYKSNTTRQYTHPAASLVKGMQTFWYT